MDRIYRRIGYRAGPGTPLWHAPWMTGLFVLLVISYNLGLSWWPFQVAMVITGFLAPVLWIFGWTDSIVKRRRADYEQEHGAYRSPRGRRRRTTRRYSGARRREWEPDRY